MKIPHSVESANITKTKMCEEYKNLLVEYLSRSNIYSGDENWEIVESPQYGRCLIAKRNIEMHEIIFCDRALFYGPRGNNYEQVSLLCN